MGGWENFPMLTWDDFEWITCWEKVAWSGRTANIMHLRKGFKHQTTPISVLVTFYIQYVTNVIWSICISYTYMCTYNINISIYIYTSLVFMTWGATKRPIWKCLDVKPKSSKLWPSKASWLQILLWWLPEELHMCFSQISIYEDVSNNLRCIYSCHCKLFLEA